jgi:threonyl-tRNA synthetase
MKVYHFVVMYSKLLSKHILGVPGFTAAMVRHLHSLRRMQRDHGWIHTLLEEAENERMHLMTFLQLKKPGPIFRFGVIVTQYIFTAGFFLAYLVSPTFCHR